MPTFDCAYLDSEPLRASKWPNISRELMTFLHLARRVGTGVAVPVGVERELHAQFLRDYDELVRNQKARSHLSRIGIASADLPSTGEVDATYQAIVRKIVADEELRMVRMSTRPAAEYFDLLLDRKPPFAADGRGFGDTVVFLSVIDDLLSRGGTGVLVTNDKRFAETGTLVRGYGVALEIMPMTEAHERLLDDIGEAVASRVRAEYQGLLAILNAHFGELEATVARDVILTSTSDLFIGTIESVDALTRLEYTTTIVTQPELWRDLTIGQELTLTIPLRATFSATVMASGWSIPTRSFRVGEELPSETSPTYAEGQRVQRELVREVEVDARVIRTGDGTYADLRILSARLKPIGTLRDLMGFSSTSV